jgi:hypothetical protein
MRKMKLSLRAIIQRKGRTTKTMQTKIRLVVVDPEKGRKYPDNFVCVLPAQFGFPSGVFEKLYGQRSREAAKGFLMEALAGELDADVRSEILRRIKAIDDQQSKKDYQKPLKS